MGDRMAILKQSNNDSHCFACTFDMRSPRNKVVGTAFTNFLLRLEFQDEICQVLPSKIIDFCQNWVDLEIPKLSKDENMTGE